MEKRIERFRTYGRRTPEESGQERVHRNLARHAAVEGMVLLKNEGVLPIKGKKTALYGAGARMTVSGGTGSGDMNGRGNVSIEQGLLNAGFELGNTAWLNRFDAEFAASKAAWRKGIEEKIKGYSMENVAEMFMVIGSYPLRFPTGDLIRAEDIWEGTDTAIYVIARQAGEGNDRKVEEGDFLLDEIEIGNLHILTEHYKRVLVVINCGGLIDLSFLDTIPGIGAVLFYGQGGTEGGNAFADLVSGRETPSGKLADTWAMAYEDYPSALDYSAVSKECEEEDYKEGIYVGYHHFSSYGVMPRFGFGYGLSYTSFRYEMTEIHQKADQVKLKALVENTGAFYSGKEVLQIYVSKPWGRMDHEAVALAAFFKTKELMPGKSQEAALSFALSELASFDQEKGQWFLEKGEYGIYLGTSVQERSLVCVLVAEEECVIEQVENVCSLKQPVLTGMPVHTEPAYSERVERITIDMHSLKRQRHDYAKPAVQVSEEVRNLVENLSLFELASLCVGGGEIGKTYRVTPGAVGWTTMNLLHMGVPNVNFADGPAGLRLDPETVVEADGTKKYLNAMPENWNWGFLRDMEPLALGDIGKGTPIYQYMTAWPAEHLLAQTWNTELLREIGRAVGNEMLETGVGLWLAPAMNIHRNPLCGRNFEYYSEDPYLTGRMAAAVTEGVQSYPGIGVTIKHFCCNNRETNRNHISENMSERTLREIYLKAFRYVVETAHPKALMSSYNRVNGSYVVNSYDLLVKVLRCEWGFKGLVMSDWGATGEGKGSCEQAPVAGNDLIMPGSPGIVSSLVEAVDDGRLTRKELAWCAAHVLNMIYDCDT